MDTLLSPPVPDMHYQSHHRANKAMAIDHGQKGFVLIVFARDILMPALRKVIFKVRQTLHKPVLMQENYTLYGVSVSRKKLHRLPFSWRVMALLL
jgi:hypothetical protein